MGTGDLTPNSFDPPPFSFPLLPCNEAGHIALFCGYLWSAANRRNYRVSFGSNRGARRHWRATRFRVHVRSKGFPHPTATAERGAGARKWAQPTAAASVKDSDGQRHPPGEMNHRHMQHVLARKGKPKNASGNTSRNAEKSGWIITPGRHSNSLQPVLTIPRFCRQVEFCSGNFNTCSLSRGMPLSLGNVLSDRRPS